VSERSFKGKRAAAETHERAFIHFVRPGLQAFRRASLPFRSCQAVGFQEWLLAGDRPFFSAFFLVPFRALAGLEAALGKI
jgi:hypothetical protein